MASPSLYEKLNMKSENSIYKSVYIHSDDYTEEGYPVVEIEAHDGFFSDSIRTKSKYIKVRNQIMKKVYKYMKKSGIDETWITFYTKYGREDHLLYEDFMRENHLIK
ncbi:hypothetical protein CW676_12170 [Macrococcoides caseolyticum]|uniref:hypothetical protein n=1 Tax=Macrococcoides caseolyticum TaxID=69966 RepID=UPI000C3434BD|nr:hypothetical protein [Macrococcus caseolyticus]PKE05704.1 hypothetical protein CW692_11990 [Macrococcus caseolyticus]PKE22906.1 hypothetical protein CW689_11995 [Macrococcus caseolyticus]PKE51808.1 hypothetical protein CW676_12170 [Macrococcus caseolyticus]PKF37410.1 hypothetical protein CW681_12235 [Macrococcus caseolyticus]STY75062.1 Uncharacterised protein [Macrococcus caseolyticus]